MEAQKIIITGGATRIGAAIAERLSGFKVQILIQYYKSKSKAENLRNNLEHKGSKIYLIKADLGKEKDVLKIVKFAKKNMGYLDCLINNASVFENDKIQNFNEISKKYSGCFSIILNNEIFEKSVKNSKRRSHFMSVIETLSNLI